MKRYKRTTMTGNDVKTAFAALDLTVPAIAKVFGKHERTVWSWASDGAPTHIAIVLEAWLAGDVEARDVKRYLRKVHRGRNDGDRYRRRRK